MVTVAEEFVDIDEDVLYSLSESGRNDYYKRAHDFFTDVQDKDIDSLTPNQHQWLTGIEEDLLER